MVELAVLQTDPLAFLSGWAILLAGLFSGNNSDETAAQHGEEGQSTQQKTPAECSLREIKKQIIIREQELDRIEEEIHNIQQQYKQQLERGAEAGPGSNRQVAAVRARLTKYKLQMSHLRRLQTVKNLIVWEVAKAQREVAEDLQKHGFSQNVDVQSALEFDTETFQRHLDEMRAGLQHQFSELEEAMQTPSVDLEGITPEMNEEFALMDQLQEEDIDPASFDMPGESQSTDTTSDTSFDAGIDVDVAPGTESGSSPEREVSGEGDRLSEQNVRPPEEILADALKDLQDSFNHGDSTDGRTPENGGEPTDE